ncbi:MAG: DVU0150 family protein [Bryobacteraceae bacterium]|jgi:hypothetical protein
MVLKTFPSVRGMSKPLALALTLLPTNLLAQEKASAMVIVADSRHLTGLTAWWVNVYNESHFYFALLTVVSIPLAGAILGGIADLLMRQIGIDLKSRALQEN